MSAAKGNKGNTKAATAKPPPARPAAVRAAPPRPGADAVVFHFWQSLNYRARLLLSFVLIAAGFVVQAAAYYFTGLNVFIDFLAGAPLAFIGGALLWVKGYDNRVDFSRLDPGASWETVERSRLTKVKELDKELGRWDSRLVDITNAKGFLALLVLLIVLTALVIVVPGLLRLLVLNAALILVPLWFTGVTRIMRLPDLLVKVNAMEELLGASEPEIKDAQLQVLMLLKGKDRRVPEDIKFRLMFPGQDQAFMGLYGQVVLNEVQGASYPYFYTVVVARKGYGLPGLAPKASAAGLTVETGEQDEVEFMVIRQQTTKTSGYHTDLAASIGVFMAGLAAARQALSLGGEPAPGPAAG